MKSPSWHEDWFQPSASANLALPRWRVPHLEEISPLPRPLTSVWRPK